MQINVVENEPCRLSVNYVADAMEILNKRTEIINHFKNAPVPGNRKGKASPDAIKMHYRTQIEDSLKRALAEEAFHNTIFEKKLKVHGPPRFDAMLLADGKFTCDFEVHTKPDFELAPFANLEIPRPANFDSKEDVAEKMLQDLRVRLGETNPYTETDFVQNGDNVIVDYEGSVDGEVLPNLCAVGEMLTVGQSNLPDFDNNVLGMSIGETREFKVVVPEGGLPSLAGKAIMLKVTLNMGSKTIPCALDDTLATRLGKNNLEEVRAVVSENAARAVNDKFKDLVTAAIATRLVNDNVINVPNWMTLSEAKYLAHNSKLEWDTMPETDKQKYMDMAEKNVKLSLIYDRIREETPDAQLSDQEVFDIIKDNLSKTNVTEPIDQVIDQMNKSGYLQILFARIKDQKVVDHILQTVRVIE
jgi:trigger factor